MNNNNSLTEIGKRIAEQRKESGLTQAQLAEKINGKRETINYWENGSRDIKSGNIVLLAEVLGVSIDWLLGMPNASKTTDKATKELCATLGLSDYTIECLRNDNNIEIRKLIDLLIADCIVNIKKASRTEDAQKIEYLLRNKDKIFELIEGWEKRHG